MTFVQNSLMRTMILEESQDLREIQSIETVLGKSVKSAKLEKSARIANLEKSANDQFEMVVDLLAEVEALQSQLTEFKEKINVPKEIMSLCSRLAKAEKEKKPTIEASKKLKGENKSASKEFETITDLLAEIEALRTQLVEGNKEKKTTTSSRNKSHQSLNHLVLLLS
ncbi:hypothetical protein NE237_012398 [Protea cynaroides]|uniref:Uncharacterized protein n=1 Tax=Protea cynaroides TaxID=273540 RepID=A0A9Q0H028_9MAGN|nr:hypothetical protein NE237_012398 [Protea cynaroides]